MKGLRSTHWWLQNSHGDVKYTIENGEAKELIHMTHGHEQGWGHCLREQGMLDAEGAKGEKSGQL